MHPPKFLTQQSLSKLAMVSIAASIATLSLKFGAYWLTGSVGLLSDAVESTVNLVAAFTALLAIWYAARPIDRGHQYGHEKIEFFASGIEGGLILIAAGSIAWYAFGRLVEPRAVESVGIGVVISIVASVINLLVARLLLDVAAERDSVVLAADGQHLMTDVLTSIGVIAGVILVRLTGIERLDPVIALIVAVNIVWTGVRLLRTSIDGLLDRALPERDQEALRVVIARELEEGAVVHAIRTRKAGSRRFVDFHLLLPGNVSVQHAHNLTHRIEDAVRSSFPHTETTVHIEPIEEPESWDDSVLVELQPTVTPIFHEARIAAVR